MIVMDIHRYLSSKLKTHHEEHCNNHFNTASIHQFGFLINRSWGTSSNKQQGGTLWQLKSLNSMSPVEILTICATGSKHIHPSHTVYMVYGHTSTIHTIHTVLMVYGHPYKHPFYDGHQLFFNGHVHPPSSRRTANSPWGRLTSDKAGGEHLLDPRDLPAWRWGCPGPRHRSADNLGAALTRKPWF